MNIEKKHIKILVIGFLAGIATGIITMISLSNNTGNKESNVIITKHDTVYTQREPVIINRVRPKLIIREKIDTVLKESFTAIVDTVIAHDTVYVEYSYPENILSLLIRPKPQQTIFITKEIEIRRPLWQDILTHTGVGLGAGLIGYGAGRIK